MKKIIVTGACGFIGFHLCELFQRKGFKIIGIDNFRNTYNQVYKKKRYNILKNQIFILRKILKIQLKYLSMQKNLK